MLNGDRLDMMALLVRVADTGRLAEASRIMGISKPVASRMMRRLEAHVGVALVRRSTRGLALTESGECLVRTARTMLGMWEESTGSLRDDPAALSGPIRVAVPVGIGQTVLMAVLAAFLRRHPGITLDCEHLDEAIDLPSRGFDLQIRAGPVHQQSVVVRDLWQVHRCIVAVTGHPPVATPRELEDHPAVRLTTFVPPLVTLTGEDGDTATIRLRPVLSVDNLFAALSAVRAGVGFAILPCFVTHPLVEAGELVELCPTWRPPAIRLSLTYPPGRLRQRRVDALIRFLREELTSEAGLGVAHLGMAGIRDTVTIGAA